jgi:GH35 family endo-1,4-beta-xylanase
MKLFFRSFSGKHWDVKRWQAEIFMADEKDYPFSIPEIDGPLIIGDLRGQKAAALHARFPVASFGEVTLPTGILAPRETPYNLNVEIARERIACVRQKQAEWSAKGFRPSDAYETMMKEAEEVFRFTALKDEPEERNARWADLSLASSMPAGEKLALEYADWGIARRKAANGFEGFLLGCNSFGYPSLGEKYQQYFAKAFNCATMPMYWGRVEAEEGKLQLENLDAMEKWLSANHIRKKGHPLFWLLSNPPWNDVTSMPLEELKERAQKRIRELCAHFKGRVEYYDIINEMHNWNIYDPEEMYELTRMAADTVREADPDVQRVVNINEPFSEYMARDVLFLDRTMRAIDVKHSLVAAEEYIHQLIRRNVDFEIIGIQMYFGAGAVFCRDLFEISRFYDKFEKYGKPVHLTEMGVPSQEGEDPKDTSHKHNYSGFTYWRASDSGFWHGPWTEDLQAEFVEGYYKVLMGKPFVTGITYWDLSDEADHFFTHSGFLNTEGEPKKVFDRIVALRQLMGI